jgi:hypothetical protein
VPLYHFGAESDGVRLGGEQSTVGHADPHDQPAAAGSALRRGLAALAGAVAAAVVIAAGVASSAGSSVGPRSSGPAGSPLFHQLTRSDPWPTPATLLADTAGPPAGDPPTVGFGPATPGPPGTDPFSPPATSTPWAPGQAVESGEDQSDPFLYAEPTRYDLFTSGVPGRPFVNVPVSRATTFGSWSPVADALPVLPPWVTPGFTWAPDLHRFGRHYVLYFTALVQGTDPGMECIGDAAGATPTGPFFPSPVPFICQSELGGDIDPRVFVAPDGSPYMLWKSDQNIGGAATPTQMWSQPLSPDGLHLVGQAAELLHPDQPWEGTIVEAPDMVVVHGAYWLFFSGNWFNQPAYAVGAARCAGPQGPCLDLPANPLVATNLQGAGPGEASVFADQDGAWLLYSPWRSLAPHPDVPPRPVEITRIGFGVSGPYLAAGPLPPPLDRFGPTLVPRAGRSSP